MKCLAEILRFAADALQKAGVTEYELDARLLLQFCTGKGRTEIFLEGETEIEPSVREKYFRLLERRVKREPVAYILGEQEFWSLPFHVSPEVLIPRPETEFLLDRVFALTDPGNFERGNILDLCCGSGVIAAVLAIEKKKRILALDVSLEALCVTRQNIRRHSLDHLVLPILGNLFSPLKADRRFSLVVTNPPYVSSVDVAQNLDPEVELYEPHLALDGGQRGLKIIRQICNGLPSVLCDGGQLFMEIGADQGKEVKDLFEINYSGCSRYKNVEIIQDYAGRDRIVHARITT